MDNDIYIKGETIPGWTFTKKCPFKFIYNHEDIRIIHTMGISHNILWFDYVNKEKDYLIFGTPCYMTRVLVNFNYQCLKAHNFNIDNNVYLLCNSEYEMNLCKKEGFKNIYYCNNNCFLDENLFSVNNIDKKYDAILVTRRLEEKRNHLAIKVPNLAIIQRLEDEKPFTQTEFPNSIFINDKHLTPSEMKIKYQESKVSLCLSQLEGACYASSESLLCGIPVVYTPSLGGRDVWYNDDNSIMSEPNEDYIKENVYKLIEKNLNSEKIRINHIKQMNDFRFTYIKMLENIFQMAKVEGVNCRNLFWSIFFNKFQDEFFSLEYIIKELKNE